MEAPTFPRWEVSLARRRGATISRENYGALSMGCSSGTVTLCGVFEGVDSDSNRAQFQLMNSERWNIYRLHRAKRPTLNDAAQLQCCAKQHPKNPPTFHYMDPKTESVANLVQSVLPLRALVFRDLICGIPIIVVSGGINEAFRANVSSSQPMCFFILPQQIFHRHLPILMKFHTLTRSDTCPMRL